MNSMTNWTAFAGVKRIAAGEPATVALQVKQYVEQKSGDTVLVFNDVHGRLVDLDLRGSDADVLARLGLRNTPDGAAQPSDTQQAAAPPRRGRPRLGVVAKEITLLPRHWAWLEQRDGGASVTLRRLVDAAMRGEIASERVRQAQEATHRFLTTMAGDAPGYEAMLRALYAGERDKFTKWTETLPPDIGSYARQLAAAAFAG